MTDFLEFTVDKFTFIVATDRWYNAQGVWAKEDESNVRIGLSDYLQKRSGDVAFAEVNPEGALVKCEAEIAVIETIKVNISLLSPVSGKVVQVNPLLSSSPEVINQDPYGAGWLAVIQVEDFSGQAAMLIDARTYFQKIRQEAERESTA